MCRKFTASLTAQFLAIKSTMLTPAFNTFATFREYESTPGVFGGFCTSCGSSLSWRTLAIPDIVDIFIGTLDEKWLTEDRDGTSQSIAKALATPNGFQAWQSHAIGGVSDSLKGGITYMEGMPADATGKLEEKQ